jgi:hypothetical protein
MKKILIIFVILVIFVAVLWIKRFIEIDICLDRGGMWDYKNNVCVYHE